MASLPQTPGAWRTAYGNGCSIHDFQTVSSASKMAQEQFFALKVIWPNHTTDDLTKQWIRRFGSSEKELFQKAESLKQDDKAWGWYLGALAANIERPQSWKIDSKIPRECGTYTLAFHSQLEVSTLPNNSGPDADKVFVTPMVTRRKVRYPEESPSLRAEKRWGQMEREPSTPRLSSPSPRSSEDSVPAEIGYSMGSVFQPSPKALLDPPTQDEETVNRALMNFLDAHHLHDERNSDWSSTRKEFVFQSAKHTTDEDQSGNEPKARSKQSGKKAKAKAREKDKEGRKPVRFVARTDGHLKVYGSPEMSAAILEVKARQRPRPPKPGDFTIEMQESAQMALWIFQEPQSHWTAAQATGATSPQDISYHRLLISQDRDEIHIVIAEYNEGYYDYLMDKLRLADSPFLKMHRFGPFQTKVSGHMMILAALLKIMVPYITKFGSRPPSSESSEDATGITQKMNKVNLDSA